MNSKSPNQCYQSHYRDTRTGDTAQLDVVLTFFGIILVFLSLMTFSIHTQESEPRPTEYQAYEQLTQPIHTPVLAYSVPFYRFFILDQHGLFALDLSHIADVIKNSDLTPQDFGLTLKTPNGIGYGTVSLEKLDISGFWMELDVEKLHQTQNLSLLISHESFKQGEIFKAAQELAESDPGGHVMLNYSKNQSQVSDILLVALTEAGWQVGTKPISKGKITLRRHPDYFVSTTYFR